MLRAMVTRDASADRRTAILDAALRCYEELGWAATTIAEVRERSGASIGSIYHHFGDKEGIATELYTELLRRYRTALLERIERTRSARSLVRSIVLHHIEWTLDHPVWARFLIDMRQSESMKQVEGELRASTTIFLREVLASMRPYIESGQIIRVPNVLYASLLLGSAQDVLRHWFRGRIQVDPRELARPLADAAWRSLAGES
jgi:AcrR family transcriptional regulator